MGDAAGDGSRGSGAITARAATAAARGDGPDEEARRAERLLGGGGGGAAAAARCAMRLADSARGERPKGGSGTAGARAGSRARARTKAGFRCAAAIATKVDDDEAADETSA